MFKNFLFYFGTGLLTPYFYSQLVEGEISIVLSVIALILGFVSLYIGKLADKVGVKILFYISVPISMISASLLHFFIAQIIYGVSIGIIFLLINIDTSNRKEESGAKFGKLYFFIQMASALSIFLGGIISGNHVVIIYVLLLITFLFITARVINR